MAEKNNSELESPEILPDRRVAKCTGCKTPLDEHHWGIPSKFCEGITKSSPRKEPKDSLGAEGCSLDSLRAELEALDVEEQILRRKSEETKLKEQIAAKRKAIQQLSQPLQQEDKPSVLTSRDLPRLPSDNPYRNTPLDDLLTSAAMDMDPPIPAAALVSAPTPQPDHPSASSNGEPSKHRRYGYVPKAKNHRQG